MINEAPENMTHNIGKKYETNSWSDPELQNITENKNLATGILS